MRHEILVFLCILACLPFTHGQVDFRAELEKSNPVSDTTTLSSAEKLAIHQTFLKEAEEAQDQQKELYGNLYVFIDHIELNQFTEATEYILQAEAIAKVSGNPGWEGWVNYRSGILYIRVEQETKAIAHYKKAAELCTIAGDSLCLGESLEQMGALTGLLGSYEEADTYFSQAVPLLKKYGPPKSIVNSLHNYGNFLSMKGDLVKAIPYLEESIETNLQLQNYRSAAKGMNNLAQTYYRLGRYPIAIEQFEKALQLNTEHGFSQNMIRNYLGMHQVYAETKEYEKSMDFLIKRVVLRDSLVGLRTQVQIERLEVEYENKAKELEYEKANSKLLSARRNLERVLGIFLLLLLLLGFGIWYFRSKSLQAKNQKIAAEQDLKSLNKILIDKNSAILGLNAKLSQLDDKKESRVTAEELERFVNTTILTGEEWFTYKSNFEKIYPGYLRKLRLDYPSLSDAEERLFLLIKLQLKTREIAAILGISNDSVKKTRQRLRKRLQLTKEFSLEEFIKNY